MSYGNHINYNTGQTCDCSLAINGGHYYPNFEVSWWSIPDRDFQPFADAVIETPKENE